MKKEFKTLITPNGEFGVIDTEIFEDCLFIGTSSTPRLYGLDITVETLKKYLNGKPLDDGETFDWDEHIGSWKLVEIVLTIKEEK
jgi:hypothetical protein